MIGRPRVRPLTSSYLVHQLFGSILYIWKQKWVPLSSETRRTPESAPVRHHEFHLRSIWLNISLKLFDQHININHTTPPHETISKIFIPRRSQLPTQVRLPERSSHRTPEAAPAQYTFKSNTVIP